MRPAPSSFPAASTGATSTFKRMVTGFSRTLGPPPPPRTRAFLTAAALRLLGSSPAPQRDRHEVTHTCMLAVPVRVRPARRAPQGGRSPGSAKPRCPRPSARHPTPETGPHHPPCLTHAAPPWKGGSTAGRPAGLPCIDVPRCVRGRLWASLDCSFSAVVSSLPSRERLSQFDSKHAMACVHPHSTSPTPSWSNQQPAPKVPTAGLWGS